MTQCRKHSVLEVCLNTTSGFLLSFAATFVVFPWFGLRSTSANFWITVIYTVISLVRSYFWRRLFNWWQHARD
jgi:biotin transporter BioY